MARSSTSVEAKLSRRQAWLMASRPRTLPASVAPVIVGTALAIEAGVFQPAAALVALLCALLIQIGSNFANDLGDFRRGTDEHGRVGPTRVTTAGLLTPGDSVRVAAGEAGVRLLFLAGKPIGEPVVQFGPFVMNTQQEIEQAIADFQSGRLVART